MIVLWLWLQSFVVAVKTVPLDSPRCSIHNAESADSFFQINRGKPAFHNWNFHESSISPEAASAHKTSTARPTLWAPVKKWTPDRIQRTTLNGSTAKVSHPWVVMALGALPKSTDDLAALGVATKAPKIVDPPVATDNLLPLHSRNSSGGRRKPEFSTIFWCILGGTFVIFFVGAWAAVHFSGQILRLMKHGLHAKHGEEGGFYEYLEGRQWRKAELVHHAQEGDMLLRRTHDGALVKKHKETTSVRKAAHQAVVPSRAVALLVPATQSTWTNLMMASLGQSEPVHSPMADEDNASSSSNEITDEDDDDLAAKLEQGVYDTAEAVLKAQEDAKKARSDARDALREGLREGKEKIEELADEAGDAVDDAVVAVREAFEDPGTAIMQAFGKTGDLVKEADKVGDAVKDAVGDAVEDVTKGVDAVAEATKSKLGKVFGGMKSAGLSKTSPLSPEDLPKSPMKDALKPPHGSAQDSQRGAQTPQGTPKAPQGVPKTPQSTPKMRGVQTPQATPKVPQGVPKTPQGGPKTPQGVPKTPQSTPKMPQGIPKEKK